MSDIKIPTLEKMQQPLLGFLSYLIDYMEFIGTQKPSEELTYILAELVRLQDSLKEKLNPFLTMQQTIEYQEKVVEIILTWNKNIEKNVINFYNANTEIARLDTKNSTILAPLSPMNFILKNINRFMDASGVLNDTLEKTNLKLLERVDFYSIFYSQIATTEAIEHMFYEPLKESLKKYDLESRYDIEQIFSVTSKWKNRHNVYQTDSKMIRNALAHFYYKMDEVSEDTVNIIFYPDNPNLMRKLHYKEFFNYIANNKFMLQSFFSVILLMALFSNLRIFYCIDSPYDQKSYPTSEK